MAPRGFHQRGMTSGISPCSANHLLLIASFTFSRSLRVMNRVMLSITRSPAFWDLT